MVQIKAKNTLPALINCKRDIPTTDSLIVAQKFRKRHKNVLKKIDNIKKNDEDNRLNFTPVKYKDKKGEDRKKYIFNRRAFSILCMSFTGKKALKWKNDFYDAFEKMEQMLLNQRNISWQQARIDGKQSRLELTDSIKKLVEIAKSSSSKNAHTYYENISKMIYSQLFDLKTVPLNFRDTLDRNALERLKMVEYQASIWLNNATETCEDYHEPYKVIKKKINSLIAVIGTINPYQLIAA